MLDLDKLLTPLEGDDPGGISLRYEPIYDQIREARRTDDASLPQGVWKHELKKADWPDVIKLSCTALSEKSKDLQVAVWLTEALTYQSGLEGGIQGFRLLTGLVKQCWEILHPRDPDGDMEHRVGLFHWLDSKLPKALMQEPFTQPVGPDLQAYTLLDWEHVLKTLNQKGNKKEKEAIALTQLEFNKSLEATPGSFYQEMAHTYDQILGTLSDLEAALAEVLGSEAPTLHEVRAPLNEGLRKCKAILEERNMSVVETKQEDAEPGSDENAAETGAEPEAAVAVVAAPQADISKITSREQAYVLLDKIADFLMKTEPHSPTSYLLKRISRWGEMNFLDLLKETIPGFDDRTRIKESFFLKNEEDSD